MLDRNGSARAPAGEISSVDRLSPTLSSTGASMRSGSGGNSGSEEMFGPFSSSSRTASSGGSGGTSMAVFTDARSGRRSSG